MERFWSILTTCTQQGKPVIDFLYPFPDLVDHFERFGFSFGKLSHNVKWKKKDYNLSG
ncbi:MAG: hypothetical protein LBU00_06530 [Treponema sp.]|jgi:hypothetical protein|nr:hypothetical protein [Treponema sp.]